jgi:hypothetical protein
LESLCSAILGSAMLKKEYLSLAVPKITLKMKSPHQDVRGMTSRYNSNLQPKMFCNKSEIPPPEHVSRCWSTKKKQNAYFTGTRRSNSKPTIT